MLRAELRRQLRDLELNVALNVAPGRCLALAGPSGAGKTSMLRMLAGLMRPDGGSISCGGNDWFDERTGLDAPPERRRCGLLFQDYALFPHMTAWRNVAYGMRGVARSKRRERATEALERFGAGALADAHPAGLSGGERQRVALARALASEPSALLLDEPLSALDPRTADRAVSELAAVVRDSGIPVVLVTHDFAQAALMADEIAVIDSGRIAQRGTAGELAGSPATAFVAELSGANVLRGEATARADGTSLLTLPSGARIVGVGGANGPAAVLVRPWDIAIEPLSPAGGASSARNHLTARVMGLAPSRGRVRVALALPEPLAAEVTPEAASTLALRPDLEVMATWKATASRVVAG
jgi:molybdate transport system ATP-binding protein